MEIKHSGSTKPILVVGSSNVDFIMKAPHLPSRGESVANCEFLQAYGGKGANQAVAAARSGGDVIFMGAVGNDVFGEEMIKNLHHDNIDTSVVKVVDDKPSGCALIMFDREGENYLTVAPGSNHSLLPEQVAENNDLIRNASIIVLQMEIPAVTNQRILDLARDAAVPVIFNYAPIGDREVKVGPGMTWLVVNETEAAALSGLEKVDSDNAAEAANILMKKGPTHIVLTLGSKGAVYFGPESSEFVDAYKVRAVDTTAAGDTFCGALATALVEGKPVVDALRMANAAAALCVCEMGAQPSIPKIQQIENFLEAQA